MTEIKASASDIKIRIVNGGSGSLTLIFTLLLLLKAFKIVSWSWVWILSPLWVPMAIILIVAFFWMSKILYLDHKIKKARKQRVENYKKDRISK